MLLVTGWCWAESKWNGLISIQNYFRGGYWYFVNTIELIRRRALVIFIKFARKWFIEIIKLILQERGRKETKWLAIRLINKQ